VGDFIPLFRENKQGTNVPRSPDCMAARLRL
jgi:hypothetical protein